MAVYFVFSDEAGAYKKERSDRFITSHPYYIRASVITSAEDYLEITRQFSFIKASFSIPYDKEVKWAYLWSTKKDRANKTLTKEKKHYFLKDFSEEQLIDYVNLVLRLSEKMQCFKIIYTVTFNDLSITKKIDNVKLYKMHLEEIMQRMEMDIQHDKNGLGLLFVDPLNNQTDLEIQKAYNIIFHRGAFFEEYRHIKDCLSFEHSHHSYGVQLADFCAGIFNSMLKGYPNAKVMFKDNVFPYIRKDKCGNYMGYGVMEILKNTTIRSIIKDKIEDSIK